MKRAAQAFVTLGIIFSVVACLLASTKSEKKIYTTTHLKNDTEQSTETTESGSGDVGLGSIGIGIIAASCFIAGAYVLTKE